MFRQILPCYRSLAFALFLVSPGIAAADTPAVIGEVKTYTAHAEDTFAALAQKYNIGYVALIAANPGIDPWLPGEGTKLILPTEYIVPHEGAPHEGIVVNVGELRLFYYAQPNGTPESFAIGIGREGKETPLGQTTIVRKAANPVWYPTVNTRADKPELPVAVPAGDDNPLGAYALYLGWPSYLIHGTNNPQGVGRQASRGCMRLYPDSIQELFERVPVGTKVTVIDQPVSFARVGGKFYMSIFPSRTQIDELEDHNSMTPQAPPGLSQMILAAAGPDVTRLDWNKIRIAADARAGYPVDITKDDQVSEPVADVPISPMSANPGPDEILKNSSAPAPENHNEKSLDAAAPVIVIPDPSDAYDAYKLKLEAQVPEIPQKNRLDADDTSDLNQGQLQKLGEGEEPTGSINDLDHVVKSEAVESRP